MSAALETLPPDQRAVLQLILKQGRGYAELSGLLRIDETAVRARAHAGLEALAPNGSGAALTPERRGQIADWLLGQQAADEAAVTFQHLEDSRAARRWAAELRDQLAPVARDHDLPELPAGRNGRASAPAASAAAPLDAGLAPAPGDGEADDAPSAAAADRTDDAQLGGPLPSPAAAEADAPARPAPARPRRTAPAGDASGLRSEREPSGRNSKVGGAILLLGVAALVAVALIVFLGGDDDGGGGSDAPPVQTTAQQQRTAAERAAADTPTVLQQVNLLPPGGREAGPGRGVAFIMLQGERPVVAVQAAEIDPNGERDVYAAWLLSRATGRARFLGFVPDFVRGERRFSVSAALPRDTARFDQVAVSRESIDVTDAPASPTDVVLVGTLRVNRAG